jgi:hypothetical protein
MNAICSKCGAQVEAAWAFCPHCAARCKHEIEEYDPPKHEKAPVKGGFSGLLLGLIAAPVLIITGGMICLTGLGVFLGVPMVVAGVCAPLIGPLLGLSSVRGNCPWCNSPLGSVALIERFSCPACNHRIVVRKQELVKAE